MIYLLLAWLALPIPFMSELSDSSLVGVSTPSPSSDTIRAADPPLPWVRHSGDRRQIIQRGNLTATIALDSLVNIPHLYAIGPVEGLQGEVTIYDGTPSIATVAEGAPHVEESMDHRAIFLVYGAAADWEAIPIPSSLSGLKAVEAFVRAEAEAAGLDLSEPFPFRMEGTVDSIDYHIIYKTNRKPHSAEEHKRAKQKYAVSDVEVQIIGFWADKEGEGVYTHPGMRTHLHFRSPDPSTSGHIDDITVQEGATLYLPR